MSITSKMRTTTSSDLWYQAFGPIRPSTYDISQFVRWNIAKGYDIANRISRVYCFLDKLDADERNVFYLMMALDYIYWSDRENCLVVSSDRPVSSGMKCDMFQFTPDGRDDDFIQEVYRNRVKQSIRAFKTSLYVMLSQNESTSYRMEGFSNVTWNSDRYKGREDIFNYIIA